MRDKVAWFFRIFWACRVSLLSGGAGIGLFCVAVPAQNLMDDLSFSGSLFGEVAFWLVVFLATILMWALPIHYGARLVLDDDGWILSRAQANAIDPLEREALRRAVRRRLQGLICWVPRFIGLAPFVALAFAISFGAETDKGATALQEGPLTQLQSRCLFIADAVAAVVYVVVIVLRRQWIDWMVDVGRNDMLERIGYVSLVVTGCFFLAAYFTPIVVAVYFPRALLIPPLFGSLVLLLCELQKLSQRSGLPLALFLLVSALTVTAANTPLHALRTISRQGTSDSRLTMDAAIARWMAANGCANAATCTKHPLVIAIDGGASRAAFMAATFVGAILDRMPQTPSEAATPGRRIFAISGVSGGAFGAAVFQAALADAQEPGNAPRIAPCRTADRTWFGYAYRSSSEHRFRWEECLQALTSGDYLSPTIVGLGFRDFIAPRHLIEDRAVLLEQSWERHYEYTTSEHPNIFEDGRICDAASNRGLCRRMAHPKDFLDSHPNSWVPLLLLNGTSVRTGRRIIASDIAASAAAGDSEPLFAEAYDLGEIMSSPCAIRAVRVSLDTETATSVNKSASEAGKTVRTNDHGVCGGPHALDGDDVRLSTAALTSARFPLVSPSGSFRMKSAPFGDQVVDGGYFENSGLTTALEVVAALEHAHLKPLLLSIANEPTEADADAVQAAVSPGAPPARDRSGLPQRPSTTPLTVYPKNGFFARMFGTLSAPFTTLIATRDGHASESEERAETFLPEHGFFRMHVDQTPNLAPVEAPDPYDVAYCTAIWQRPSVSMAKVSMSWWLSALVQADLDAQKCSTGNQKEMNALMKELVRG